MFTKRKSYYLSGILTSTLFFQILLPFATTSAEEFEVMIAAQQAAEDKENFSAFKTMIDVFQINPSFESGWETWGETSGGHVYRLETREGLQSITGGAVNPEAKQLESVGTFESTQGKVGQDLVKKVQDIHVQQTKIPEKLDLVEAVRQGLGENPTATLPESTVAQIEAHASGQQEPVPSVKENQIIEVVKEENLSQVIRTAQIRKQTRQELIDIANERLVSRCPNYKEFATVTTEYPVRRVCKKVIKIKEHEENYQALDNQVFYREEKVYLEDQSAYAEGSNLRAEEPQLTDVSDYFEQPKSGSLLEDRLNVHYLREGFACAQDEIQMKAKKSLLVDWVKYQEKAQDCLDMSQVVRKTLDHKVQETRERLERVVNAIEKITKHDYILATPLNPSKLSDVVAEKVFERPSRKVILRPSIQAREMSQRVGASYFNQGERVSQDIYWSPSQAEAIIKRDIVPAFRIDLAVLGGFYQTHSKQEKVAGKYEQYRTVIDRFVVRENLLGPFQRLACMIHFMRHDNRAVANGDTLVFAVHEEEVPFLSQREVIKYDDIFRTLREKGDCQKLQDMKFDRRQYREALRMQRFNGIPPIVRGEGGVEIYE